MRAHVPMHILIQAGRILSLPESGILLSSGGAARSVGAWTSSVPSLKYTAVDREWSLGMRLLV